MQETTESYKDKEFDARGLIFSFVDGAEGLQGSDAWLEFKKDKIGSSQAASIAGKNPYETPLMCYEAIINKTSKPVAPAMQRGKDEEPRALRWLNSSINSCFLPKVVQSVEFPMLMASLDGFMFKDGKPTGCEIKTPGIDVHLRAIEGVVPEHYLWQIYHQMLVTGAESWLYVSWTGRDAVVIEVKRDEESIAKLLEIELKFCNKLFKREPPEATDKDWVDNTEFEVLAWEYKRLERDIKEMTSKRDYLKEEILKEVSNIHPRVRIGSILKIQRIEKKGSVDYSKIPELENVDLEQYRKPSVSYWRMD